MYFVDRQKIEDILVYLEKRLELLDRASDWGKPVEGLALERIVQSLIDSVLDVGNSMIDGFIMRDPGSYEDIIDILTDEKVISEEMSRSFKEVLPLRKMVVQDYLEIDHQEMKEQIVKHAPAFKQYPKAIRDYLTNELGPVSAFKK
ncbi:DUF86 domain-containing protein [Peribacillus tepidiphilus]|jgi:uncharacterized protein YutE (UPF0331/DUF86 family)|uniref:DUF86 domain-containing protein n=1 Tax=Peribacillus tepidiphilus TaxID=2652445 RepID=UPI0012909BB4|nr:DUF86 domain-containing protein [Peribacillus tepidiphilus]